MLALSAFAGCGEPKGVVDRAIPFMGSMLSVTMPAADADRLAYTCDLIRETGRKLYDEVRTDRPDSQLATLNRVGRTLRVPVSRDVFRLLKIAARYQELTHGAFDITTGPLAQLWGFGGPIPSVPLSPAVTRAALSGTGSEYIDLDQGGTVHLTSPHTRVSLDALAPGYALDLALREIRRRGMERALLNVGGRYLRCLGEAAEGQPWAVPLVDPANPGEHLGNVGLPSGSALALVRLYDDFVTIAGHRYGSVMDPLSGRPAEGTAVAFVVGPTATEAAAVAHALVVTGVPKAGVILREFPRCDALILPDRSPLQLWMTEGFQKLFEQEMTGVEVRMLER